MIATLEHFQPIICRRRNS